MRLWLTLIAAAGARGAALVEDAIGARRPGDLVLAAGEADEARMEGGDELAQHRAACRARDRR